MPRYKLKIEYNGRPFVGWQRQATGCSVQGALEAAVECFTGEKVIIYGAGRTDTGVHAIGQVAHVDLSIARPLHMIRDALNFHLRPEPIAVISATEVSPDFHARFSANSRTYLYRIINRRSPLTIESGFAWWIPVPLDILAMREAASVLLGHHNFSSFRSAFCQAKSPIKTLDRLDISVKHEEISIHVHAKSFLHNQVRIIVGSLRNVGEGKWSSKDIERILKARDRRVAGQTAIPEGLYLLDVGYSKSKGE